MPTKSSSGAGRNNGNKKSLTSETSETGLHVTPEKEIEITSLLEALQYRATALVYIESLSRLARQGDQLALRYLHQIAENAVVELERQSVEGRREVAASVYEWPVMMTIGSAWNRERLNQNLDSLGLGRDCNFITRVDALAVKSTPLKEIVVRIMALLLGLKNERDAMALITAVGDSIRAEGLGEYAVGYATILAMRKWSEHKRLNHEKFEGICKQLGIKVPGDVAPLKDLGKLAGNLPEFNSTKSVKEKWFTAIMDVLEGFTGGRYDKERYNLRSECGFVLKNDADAESRQGEIKNKLRDRMKKAFDNMLVDDIETHGQ